MALQRMHDNFLPRMAGVFSILAIVVNFVAFGIGASRGLSPPNTVNFGSSDDLVNLALNYDAHILPLALGLLSPFLAIPVALGWFHVLKDARGYASFGLAMFFVGMTLVVILDVLELVLVVALAPAYASADAASQSALLGFGATLGLTRDVLGYVGHFFSFGLAQIAFGLAILRVRAVPRWLGWLSFVPGIILGWLATMLDLSGASGPVVPLGVLSFVIWNLGMAVVLLRWRSSALAVT
jgi:Domain of unknown function (DUF4386)